MNQTAQSWWFIFYKDQLLLEKKEDGIYTVPCGESSPIVIKEKTTVHNITTLERKNCKAFSLSSPIEESEQWIMIGLRASYEYLPLSHYQTAGKAHEILHWDRNSRFCSACGTPMEQKESIMKRCPKCGREVYPSISTAILVLVRKKDSLLLVHARNFKGTFNSLVAGFLETGETLEECVAREVKEETGMEVKKAEYLFSLPNIYVYSGFTVHTLDLFFRCTVTDTLHYQAMDDAADVFFLPLKDIHTEDFGLSSIRKGVGIFLKEMGE